jgi:ABC-type phosphate transport system substrate-binding protein
MTAQLKIGIRIVTVIICLLLWAANSCAQVAVIANRFVPMDTISKSELLDFYTSDIKKWSDGQPVILLDLKSKGDVKSTFYNFLGKSASRMKSIWLKKMLLGEGDPPESMISEQELLNKVASTIGALGFVSKANIREDVKLLMEIKDEKK